MKTEKYINDEGEFRAFGFPNTLVGKALLKEALETLPGLKIRSFEKAWGVETFCEFTFKGIEFSVSEPYGDNSYYDIFCNEPNTKELEQLLEFISSSEFSDRLLYKNLSRLARLIAATGLILLGVLAFNLLNW